MDKQCQTKWVLKNIIKTRQLTNIGEMKLFDLTTSKVSKCCFYGLFCEVVTFQFENAPNKGNVCLNQ